MISSAHAKFIRVSSRKVRLVIDLIRGKKVNDAMGILQNINKKSREPIIKVLKSAMSNSRPSGINEENLYVSKISANEGPMLKRFKAASFGRAVMVRHRLCHITVELDELKKPAVPKIDKDKKKVKK